LKNKFTPFFLWPAFLSLAKARSVSLIIHLEMHMHDLLEVRQFYFDTNAGVRNRILRICREIITEPMIAKKIELGMSLAPLLEFVLPINSRLNDIADTPVLQYPIAPRVPIKRVSHSSIAEKAAELGCKIQEYVLFQPDIPVLAHIADHFSAHSQGVDTLGELPLPLLPARDPSLKHSADKPFRFPKGGSILSDKINYLGFLSYVLIDVEISAMEVCASMAIRYREMPDAFVFNMARQIWDEARHAAYIQDNYIALGGKLGDFPYTNTVIERYNAASDLLDALIVQQVLQESNAVENNITLANDLAKAGRTAEALGFMAINNDEALHARIGFNWIEYLAKKNSWSSDYLFRRTLSMCRRVGLPLFGMGTWTNIIRTTIGCPVWLSGKRSISGWLLFAIRMAIPSPVLRAFGHG
jgi:hypothetical protein